MGGQLFTARQTALLKERFAQAGANSIPGAWLIDGDVDWSKIDVIGAYADLDTRYATAAQGLSADVAFSWGDHSVEGYLTLATTPQARKEILDATLGTETTMVLSNTPVGAVQVFYKATADTFPRLWREGAGNDYTISGTTITFVSKTPLDSGDEVHVYYLG